MRRILLIITAAVTLSSCQQSKCWECEYDTPNGTQTQVVCGKTRSEIKDYEAQYFVYKVDCKAFKP